MLTNLAGPFHFINHLFILLNLNYFEFSLDCSYQYFLIIEVLQLIHLRLISAPELRISISCVSCSYFIFQMIGNASAALTGHCNENVCYFRAIC